MESEVHHQGSHRRGALVWRPQSCVCPRQDKDIKLTVQDNLYKWTAYLRGPEGTPFEGGCFQVLLDVQVHFCAPASAPAVCYWLQRPGKDARSASLSDNHAPPRALIPSGAVGDVSVAGAQGTVHHQNFSPQHPLQDRRGTRSPWPLSVRARVCLLPPGRSL